MNFGSAFVYTGNKSEDEEEVKVIEGDDLILSDSDVSDDDGETCLLDILDTAGQEEYSSLKDQYVRTGNGFVIIYSITDKESFTEAEAVFRWLKRLKEEESYAILVANKQDLKDSAVVSSDEGKELAKKLEIPFFETSAKAGTGIVHAMKGLIRTIPRTGSDYKIVMLGSGAVGKSSITVRFVNDTFLEDYDPTIEDSYRKMINVDGLTAANKESRKHAKKAKRAKKQTPGLNPFLGQSKQSRVQRSPGFQLQQAPQQQAQADPNRRGILNNMFGSLRSVISRPRSGTHQVQQQQQLQQQQQQQQIQQLQQQQHQQIMAVPQLQSNYIDLDLDNDNTYVCPMQQAPMAGPSAACVPPPPPQSLPNFPATKTRKEKKTDANVVLISLGTLEQEPNLVTGDPIRCKQCEAVLTETATLESDGDKKIWKCEFCGCVNRDLEIADEEIPKGDCLDYMLSPATEPEVKEEEVAMEVDDAKKEKTTPGVIVYCMDISSSMQAACSVPESQASWRQERLGVQDQNVISRLNCIQMAVERLAEQLKNENPGKKILLVVFSSQVLVKAGGSLSNLKNFNDVDNKSFEDLLTSGVALFEGYPLKPLEESYEEIVDAVKALRTTGCTALGPALSICMGFVSSIPSSEIVLCTDGEPNVGVGSGNGGNKAAFYEKVGKYARSKNVTINILAVEGGSVDLATVSAAAEHSGGTTNKLNPAELVRQLRTIAQNEVVATSVTVRFLLHPNFVFDEPEYPNNLSQLEKEVGSARKETDLTFRFKMRDQSKTDLTSVPFQVQIMYTRHNGMKCLRVLSKRNKITSSRKEMEENISATVMSVSAMKTTAQLAKQGKAKDAQHMLKNVKRMVNRGAKSSEQREAKLAFNNEVEAWDDQLTYNNDIYAAASGHCDLAAQMIQQSNQMYGARADVGATKFDKVMARKKMNSKAKDAYYVFKSDMM